MAVATEVASFGGVLASRVDEHLDAETLRVGYRRLHRKGAIVAAWYVVSYVLMVRADSWLMGTLACLSLALSMVAVGFNIQHDANHNAFFPTGGRRRLTVANRIAGLSLNAIGGSSKRWIDGHVHLHHSAPNVVGRDFDIELAPFARMAPAQEHRRWHAYQHLYVWLVYGFTSGSIIIGDVVNTVQEAFRGNRRGKGPTLADHLGMLGSKGLFVLAMVVVPLLLHPWWIVVLGAVFVLAVSGFLLGVVFQLAHVVEEADFAESANRPEMRWHEWQVRSSVNFCHGGGMTSRAVTWFTGGLNHQTEHHLLPNLPHTVYPVISPIVAETCAEFGIRYHVQPTLRVAVRSHYRHLRRLGRP